MLGKRNQLCFAPNVSMVINHDNWFDVADFAKLALEEKATGITFYFDYTENDMNAPYFSQPDLMRPALKTMMELERVLSDRVLLGFRLWVPIKELAMMEEVISNESDDEIRSKYQEIVELADNRSILGEWKERNILRKKYGKPELSFEEDTSITLRVEERCGRDICLAPWSQLDLYPNGRIDFCGWYAPTQNLGVFIDEEGKVDWNEVVNSYEYMRARKKILDHQYDECLSCCPMNDVANPIVDRYKYSCPSYHKEN